MSFQPKQPVKVSLFDGQIKDRPGTVLGSAKNSAGDEVYLVELGEKVSSHSEREVGMSQLEHGKRWVLSLYTEELQAA